ncbi:phosphodiester glycosidase family protein [Deinococcus yavapaiensis]|uniref:Uncharacterized protein DUF2233 n=1 Tax=Deinococcus yavapaiensis KR-236 TaxID=694435 RepID=A0A318SCZ5_9DEIO|nr:phosphodiester glycosidase family protein [Deinococcus yavapaiensis]PYE54228.1 uncharacterized protein DUF2233 [Deinococcus yavapaiensis KR-236]
MTRRALSLTLLATLLSVAAARPVAIGGQLTSPRVETKTLPSGQEGLPVWFLTRLGVDVLLNSPSEIRLRFANRELRWTGAWSTPSLSAPEQLGGSWHVSLDVLRALGVTQVEDAPDIVDFPAPAAQGLTPETAPASAYFSPFPTPVQPPVSVPAPAPSPSPAPSAPPAAPEEGARLASTRTSRTLRRALETQRVVLELTKGAQYSVTRDERGVTLVLADTAGDVSAQTLESGDSLTVTPGSGNLHVRLETGANGASTVFTLDDPPRIVVDTVTNLDPSVTPPPDVDKLPAGVMYRNVGKLHLVSFDDTRFEPRVVSAPLGQAKGVADLVRDAGAIAGVNGGYFDPKSALPVDLVARGGMMVAPSLERRATLGFTDSSVLFGFPKPRYVLSGPWGSLTVNTVGAAARPQWLTLFVADGRTPVGAGDLVTLFLDLGKNVVSGVANGVTMPRAGDVTVTFDPKRFPNLPRFIGGPAKLDLMWQANGWETVREALAAGPLLVDDGKVVVDPVREGFDTGSNVWRPTRQVAFAVLSGKPTIAYFEQGTPEEFARALASVGVTRALRLDSGSSATVFFGGGYLNTVWSRPVPNAIVFVPKVSTTAAGR